MVLKLRLQAAVAACAQSLLLLQDNHKCTVRNVWQSQLNDVLLKISFPRRFCVGTHAFPFHLEGIDLFKNFSCTTNHGTSCKQ